MYVSFIQLISAKCTRDTMRLTMELRRTSFQIEQTMYANK